MNLKMKIFRGVVLLLLLFGFGTISFSETVNYSNVLNAEELAWLKAHPTIKVAPDLYYAPIEFEDHGDVKGIAIDYLRWMEAHYPIQFDVVKYPTWQAQLDAMKVEEIDMLSGAAKTPERTVYMNFTSAYISSPNVILRRKDHPAIESEDAFLKLKVAAINGYAVEEFLRIRYTNLNIVEVTNVEEGLVKLSNGDVDAMVTESYLASYYVTNLKMSNLSIEEYYKVDFPLNLCMATRKNAPELAVILDKMIKSMPEKDRLLIEQKWVGIGRESSLSRNVLYGFMIGIGILMGALVLIILWNRTLKGRVEEKTQALSKLNAELEQKVERRTHLLSETNKQLELSMYTLQIRDEELQTLNHDLEESLEALRTSQKKVIEMEKVAALGKLVATVAHEINTPLGNCIMMTSFEWDKHVEYKNYYQHHFPVDAVAEEYFSSIESTHEILRSSLDRLTLIVNRFKSLAVQNLDQHSETFDLADLIELSMLQYRQLKYFEWTILPDMPMRITGIKSAYEELFMNLISNSVIHGFGDGFTGQGHIDVNLEHHPNGLVIEFKDNGVGVHDDLIDKVTEPLFSTNRSGGIGFNIIMNILNHTLDGEMVLDNSIKEGLRIVVLLKNVEWILS